MFESVPIFHILTAASEIGLIVWRLTSMIIFYRSVHTQPDYCASARLLLQNPENVGYRDMD